MKRTARLAVAAALAALVVTACAKKTDQTTTTDTSQTTTASATADPAASSAPGAASAAATTPAVVATTTPQSVTASGSNGAASGGYIDLPVYPGSAEAKDQGMTASSNTGSVTVKIYTTKDDTKAVADWYKGHLPASFKNSIITSGDKTVATFVDEHTTPDGKSDGDQSVMVTTTDDKSTRVQLATKHGT